MTIRFGTVFGLAKRDLLHGWQAAACLVVAVTVALLPLLLLFALKFGVVNNLIGSLRDDPRVREIRLIRDLSLESEWLEDLRSDNRVAFLLPRARYLAGSVKIRSHDSRRPLDSRMIPTADGDPYLAGMRVPIGLDQVVLTKRASIELNAGLGDPIVLDIQRVVDEMRERVRHEGKVIGIVPRDLLQTDDIFVSPELESAIERWREGFSVAELGWQGVREKRVEDESARNFASFRLFARDVRDVPGLRDRLLGAGLDVETKAAAVETALEIETGLNWIFLSVTALASAGFLLTLGLHLAATVVEKSRELSVLRLLGLSSLELSLMPSMQGMIIAASGAAIAALVAFSIQPTINGTLVGLAGLQGQISALKPLHLLIAILAATSAGGLAGCVAGYRAAKLEPAQGLCYE